MYQRHGTSHSLQSGRHQRRRSQTKLDMSKGSMQKNEIVQQPSSDLSNGVSYNARLLHNDNGNSDILPISEGRNGKKPTE